MKLGDARASLDTKMSFEGGFSGKECGEIGREMRVIIKAKTY